MTDLLFHTLKTSEDSSALGKLVEEFVWSSWSVHDDEQVLSTELDYRSTMGLLYTRPCDCDGGFRDSQHEQASFLRVGGDWEEEWGGGGLMILPRGPRTLFAAFVCVFSRR